MTVKSMIIGCGSRAPGKGCAHSTGHPRGRRGRMFDFPNGAGARKEPVA